MGYNMYEIQASVAQLVEQPAFNRLVVGSSPTGGIMNHINDLPWLRIDHMDGTQKVFFTVDSTSKCFDMASFELTEAITKKINDCQQEIAEWNQLLQIQKEWTNAKASD